MNRNKELAKNTAIIALGKICTQFISFLLLPFYTRFLTTEEYGSLDIILVCINLIAPIITLQIERSIFRYLIDARKKEESQNEIIVASCYIIAPAVILSSIIAPIACYFLRIENALLISLLLVMSILINAAQQVPRGLGKNFHYSVASILMGLINAVTSIVTVTVFGLGIKGVIIGYLVSYLAGFLYIFISMRIAKRVKMQKCNKKLLKEMMRYSIPLIPSEIGYWAINVSDRLLIAFFLGSSLNGIYATSVKFPALIVSLYNLFNMSWQETVSLHIKDNDINTFISRTMARIMAIFVSISSLMCVALPFVYRYVIGEMFLESYKYIAILNLGAIFNIIMGFLGGVYIAIKRTKEIAKMNIATAILNILINLALIRFIGVWAAVVSTVLAYMIVFVLRFISIQKDIKVKLDYKTMAILLCLYGVSLLGFYNNVLAIKVIAFVAVMIASLLVNREIISKVLSTLKKKVIKDK